MSLFNASRIADPVHKTIGLSVVEANVISTQVFQRLRNVKQLGLANYVFPGADYSRFSHSLGVCHITGRILDAIGQSEEIEDREKQLYRLAGLLHDVGHYPYSHAMEESIRDHYGSGVVRRKAPGDGSHEATRKVRSEEEVFDHEDVGKHILTRDPELTAVLERFDFDPEEIYSIFTREKQPRFVNLISSDLDADRIDYLLRTAHHTGLPYGSVDIDYLLSQMRVDESGRICITSKALRTADHFLLSRYFDYQQVPYHKTVAALELTLKDVIVELLRQGELNGSAGWVTKAVENGTWRVFDDAAILQKIRDLQHSTEDDVLRVKAKAITERIPPKLVASQERLGPRDRATSGSFVSEKRNIKGHIPQWAERFEIDEELWYVWDVSPMALTKVGSLVPASILEEADGTLNDEFDQAIRVLDDTTKRSKSIMELDRSLMHLLADSALYPLRVYVLFPPGKEKHRGEISRVIKGDLPYIPWE